MLDQIATHLKLSSHALLCRLMKTSVSHDLTTHVTCQVTCYLREFSLYMITELFKNFIFGFVRSCYSGVRTGGSEDGHEEVKALIPLGSHTRPGPGPSEPHCK